MNKITNPILKGFNPDPSIIRVEDDYYIVTSTFEWFPGCQIHHSKDLKNWQLISRPLDRVSQLDLKGVPDSCGVWAPCLSYHRGTYYLLYSNVKSFAGEWKDTPNYLVTANNIEGPWSEPTFVNASGFDASLFHDDDGKSYIVNMLVDHRHGKFFAGIILQQYDIDKKTLVGKIDHIFSGSAHGKTEGPHLYKRNGFYYLITAEGGTGYGHCLTIARAKSITGPYEIHPENPVFTAKYQPDNYLQKTGHGDIIETQHGEWYAVYLASRPLTTCGRCILGRETAIEKVRWAEDDWLYLDGGGQLPRREVAAPDLPGHQFAPSTNRLTFDSAEIDINFQALRVPLTSDWVNQTDRPGFLRLYGRQSLSSCFTQSLLGRRIQAHHSTVETCLEFNPKNFQQMAGLVCYYNTGHYYYLHISGDEFGSYSGRKFLTVLACDDHQTSSVLHSPIEVTNSQKIYLKAEVNHSTLEFSYALTQDAWQKIDSRLDASILSDDYVEHPERHFHPCFTGAFYALACQDISGQHIAADFEYFSYSEHHD